MNREFNDSLDDIFDSNPRPKEPGPARVEFKTGRDYEPAVNRLVVEKCKTCGGTGRFRSYSGRDVGPCYKCKGQGEKAYKTSTEHRARQREKAADKRAEAQTALGREAAAFIQAHEEVFAFLTAAAKRNTERGGTFEQYKHPCLISDLQFSSTMPVVRELSADVS